MLVIWNERASPAWAMRWGDQPSMRRPSKTISPALGAALMTFFGYAVSDATSSWLLYQGMLFVLVMMFVPAGLTGLFSTAARLAARRGWPLAVSVSALAVAALLCAAGGVVFVVEMLQRLCSQDYRSIAARGNGWPPIPLFDRSWAPGSISTWLVPAALLATAALLGWAAHRGVASTSAQQPDAVAPLDRKQALS